MKNFCTDIQETAKLRGLTRGGQCRNKQISQIVTNTETINISIDIEIEGYNSNDCDIDVKPYISELIYESISPKEISNSNTNLLDKIIKQIIN